MLFLSTYAATLQRRAELIAKKKALQLERMDDEARAGGSVKANAARSSTPPRLSSTRYSAERRELSSRAVIRCRCESERKTARPDSSARPGRTVFKTTLITERAQPGS